MADTLPFGLKIFDCLDSLVSLHILRVNTLKLFNYLILLLKIRPFGPTGSRTVFLLLLKEIIAGSEKTVPHLVGMFLGHSSNCFPFLL